jgi:Dyp-type peroxidase family
VIGEDAEQRAVKLVHLQRAEALPGGRDHFGFFDGIAQPALRGAGVEPRPGDGQPDGAGGWRDVATGEVLLGYEDEDGALPAAPLAPFERNGTFVVYRKLAMDTAAFRRYMAAQSYPGGAAQLAAKIVGRWPDGTPLALSPDAPDAALAGDSRRINAFGYDDDPGGLKCPLGAHIRRANPRDSNGFFDGRLSNRHRLVRRGRAYGKPLAPGVVEDDGVDRGLVFVCLQADIWRQFETVQALWIDDGDPFGLGRDKDFLVGEPHGTQGKMTIQGHPPHFLKPQPRFVTLRGGEYLFQPSMSALRYLARA